jgi:peptidoglycan/xylan/chitin deacetylase (PgdA/CDA1 family)
LIKIAVHLIKFAGHLDKVEGIQSMREQIKKSALRFAYYTGLYHLISGRYAGAGTIFAMHKVVGAKTDSLATQLTTTVGFLDRVIAKLRPRADFITLDEVYQRLECDKSEIEQRPFIALTFDDGFRDNLTLALPILRKHGVPATIYVPSGAPDRNLDPWPWRLEKAIREHRELSFDWLDLPRYLSLETWAEKQAAFRMLTLYVHRNIPANRQVAEMLLPKARVSDEALIAEQFASWDELRELASDPLITIGGHGLTHASLRDLEEDHAMAEIRDGKARLTAQLGVPVLHFAYPYGERSNFGPREITLAARAGFVTAVMNAAGNIFPHHRHHLMSLPRCGLGGSTEGISAAVLELYGTPRALGSNWRNPVVIATEELRA